MRVRTPYAIDADWPTIALSDVTTKIGSGATPRGGAEFYLPERETFAFVRSQNVYDRWFDVGALAFITDDQAHGLRGVSLRPGDVLLNITGDGVTFGRAAMVDESALPACVNQHVSIIRADQEKVLPGYLLAYLTHPEVKPYVASFNSGGSRRAITKSHIGSFQVPLPPIEEQRAIAATLGVIDDKIESNRRARRAADELGDAVWRHLINRTADCVTLNSLISSGGLRLSDGYRTRSDELGKPGIPILRVADLVDDHYSIAPDGERIHADFGAKYSEKVAMPGDACVTTKGTVGRTALIRKDDPQAVYSPQLCFLRATAQSPLPPAALYRWLRSPSFASQALTVQHQTDMAAYVSLADFRRFTIPVVDPLAAELRHIEALDDVVASKRREADALAGLRDALLPELLSGRIRVRSDAGPLDRTHELEHV